MLDLNSPRWSKLKSSVGGSGNLAAQLLDQIRNGDAEQYAELQHQACHQFTLGDGNVAYAIVPHLVDIAGNLESDQRTWPLSIVGNIEAVRCVSSHVPPIPDDLSDDYVAAVADSFSLTSDALNSVADRYDSYQLFGALAALRGMGDLAMQLFLSGQDLSCPVCGELISFTE